MEIVILVVGFSLILYFFTIRPRVKISSFKERANQIRIGMTKNQVWELLKIRPKYSNVDSNGTCLEYYEVKSTSSDMRLTKVRVTERMINFSIYYENDRVVKII